MTWHTYQSKFEWDGSLRDIYVLNTDIRDWQILIDMIRESRLEVLFVSGDVIEDLPEDISFIFKLPHDISYDLNVHLGRTILRTHFFVENEIEIDLDPREVRDQADFDRLISFMRNMAEYLNKDVVLAPENCIEDPILIIQSVA